MEERPVVLHQGMYKPTATVTEAVFMITGMTIGAGILAIPYAVQQVGLLAGLGCIAAIGLVMLLLNLMIGEIAIRTRLPLQLPGFAEKYLGKWAKTVLSFTVLSSSFGSLVVYIVGEGRTLATLFGGNDVLWSIIFWSLGSFCILAGLQRIKLIEKAFGIVIMAIIAGISMLLLPHFKVAELYSANLNLIFLPIGVILFAMHATPAIVEAHTLLPGSERHFRRAVILGTLIPTALYMLFAAAVVGFNGAATTEIATIGIGTALGPAVAVFANVFAILAMSTGFMGLGTALKEILTWDFKLSDHRASFVVIALPFSIFLLGARGFISILSLIGGVFIAIESIILCGVYLRARQLGDIVPTRYQVSKNGVAAAAPVVAVFGILLIVSVVHFFVK